MRTKLLLWPILLIFLLSCSSEDSVSTNSDKNFLVGNWEGTEEISYDSDGNIESTWNIEPMTIVYEFSERKVTIRDEEDAFNNQSLSYEYFPEDKEVVMWSIVFGVEIISNDEIILKNNVNGYNGIRLRRL